MLETFETSNSMGHILVPRRQAVYWISNIFIIAMHYIHTILCLNLLWYSISELQILFPVQGSAFMSSFSFVESVQNYVSKFINFPFRDHSFSSSIMWSVLTIFKARGDQQVLRFSYSSIYPSYDLISKASSKIFLVQEIMSHC